MTKREPKSKKSIWTKWLPRLLMVSILSTIWASGCETLTAPQPGSQFFFLPKTLDNYEASGRILLTISQRSYTGELEFSLSNNLELRLQIFTPLVGTLLYEIRANPSQFMILDFRKGKYFLGQNTSPVRRRWLGVDITLTELSWVIWGRMRQNDFSLLDGEILSSRNIKLTGEGAEFFINLGSNSLIQQMFKEVEGIKEYEVSIAQYEEYSGNNFPKTIQILHTMNGNQLRLVMNNVNAGRTPFPELVFHPPEGMESFQHE